MDVVIFQDPAAKTEKRTWIIEILKREQSLSTAYYFPEIKQ